MHSTVCTGVELCMKHNLLAVVVSKLGSLGARASDSGLQGRWIDSRAGLREVLAWSYELD